MGYNENDVVRLTRPYGKKVDVYREEYEIIFGK
jgi:hypothetical protein